MNLKHLLLLTIVVAAGLTACGKDKTQEALPNSNGRGPAPFDPGTTYAPLVTASNLTAQVTNPFFPLPVGGHWVYEGQTPDGFEHTEIDVLPGGQAVWGTMARIVHDVVMRDGALIEDTTDLFGQDTNGNTWYLGEDTTAYDAGTSTKLGTWTAGVDGALPGVALLGASAVGDIYRQEFKANEAEDVGEVVAINVAAQVPAGSFTGCVKTRDRTPLGPRRRRAQVLLSLA